MAFSHVSLEGEKVDKEPDCRRKRLLTQERDSMDDRNEPDGRRGAARGSRIRIDQSTRLRDFLVRVDTSVRVDIIVCEIGNLETVSVHFEPQHWALDPN